jgi:hypothetical protein
MNYVTCASKDSWFRPLAEAEAEPNDSMSALPVETSRIKAKPISTLRSLEGSTPSPALRLTIRSGLRVMSTQQIYTLETEWLSDAK